MDKSGFDRVRHDGEGDMTGWWVVRQFSSCNCYSSEAMHHHLKWSSDKLCKYDVDFLTLNVNQTLSYICGILVNWQGQIQHQVQSCRISGWGLIKLTKTETCKRCWLGWIYWSNIWLFVNDIWIVQADTVVNSDKILNWDWLIHF